LGRIKGGTKSPKKLPLIEDAKIAKVVDDYMRTQITKKWIS
jgi:hypothetical protein